MTAERKKFTIATYREKTGAKAPQRLLDLRRAQLEVHNKISKSLAQGPRTVPEVAHDTGIPSKDVLWYMMTYYKYGELGTAGKTDGGYYRYVLKERK